MPCYSTVEEVSFELSHHGISSTDSKVRTALHVSIIDSGSGRVKAELHVMGTLTLSGQNCPNLELSTFVIHAMLINQ